MYKGERCFFETIAQNRVKGVGGTHPVQCLNRQECFAREDYSECLRVINGEEAWHVVGDLAYSAIQSEAIVKFLLNK